MAKERKVDSNLIQVGLRVREARKARGETLDDLAVKTGLSKGLLSKVENFRALPSLPVLAQIATALGVDMAELVKGIGADSSKPYVLVRADERTPVDRDDAVGFRYEAMTARGSVDSLVQTFVLTIKPGGRRSLVSTEGEQFVYLLSGTLDFVIGDERVAMRPGDALAFDGRVPHVPENHGETNAELLAVYILNN